MPNKTIYVSDDDLQLFEKAQELAGTNLSSAIVQALRRFIELEEAKNRGFEEITVIVNSEGAHRRKRFLGTRLARRVEKNAKGKGTQIQSIYRTAGKRYALHTRIMTDWELTWGDPEQVGDPNNWGVGSNLFQKIMSWGYDWETFKESGDYSLQIFETLEDLKVHISTDFFKVVSLAMDGPEIEELDI